MRTRLIATAWLTCAVSATGAWAQDLDELPGYRPREQVSGTIRLWGHGSFKADFMGDLVRAWAEGFASYHPDVKLENRMYGTASAIGALFTGVGDIAILGEEISPAATRRSRGSGVIRRWESRSPPAVSTWHSSTMRTSSLFTRTIRFRN
jgi:ABC-type phosphate transport system substrate-binding protein